jgi:hypothetical protein
MKTAHKFKLGQRVKDRVTGFTGIATNRLEYLNGCIQYCVKPQHKEGEKIPDGEYIDQQQLELVDEGITVKSKKTGGYTDIPKGH